MSFTVIIPARYASTRLPGKALLDIGGKPMLQHVWERASQSRCERVLIATDDERIAGTAAGFGAEVCMTSTKHPSGTDRLQEVVDQLQLPDEHIVVNVQGDEPLIPPGVIDQVASNLRGREDAGIATLCEPLTESVELRNPNIVKVVTDREDMALYFSRAPIPWPREAFVNADAALPDGHQWRRHIGLYAYRTAFLHNYVAWPPAPLEQLEALEQLRALYHRVPIHTALACEAVPPGVDTIADLQHMRDLIELTR
ncbi:MAG: 3-deoxy-manno-octulosonate cytidylyltransferase [Pseudomonadota bacterium]